MPISTEAGNREGVDHGGEDREIHRVGGVPDLPGGADARIDQQVVGGGEVDEEDVEHEGPAADRFIHRLGAHRQVAMRYQMATMAQTFTCCDW
jgi:hypothetical protein